MSKGKVIEYCKTSCSPGTDGKKRGDNCQSHEKGFVLENKDQGMGLVEDCSESEIFEIDVKMGEALMHCV